MPPKIGRREFLRQLLMAAGGTSLGRTMTRCAPALPLEKGFLSGALVPLTILHVNDLHGALTSRSANGGEQGGAANLVGLIDRERASAPGPVLLLDAGDAFQGTLVSNLNYGQAVVEVMNIAGVDACALGNHEFDWGLDVLQARIQEASFPFLAANLEAEPGQMPEGVLPYTILDAGDVRVGVLGLTYHDLTTIVRASAIEGLRSLPPVPTVRRYLPELTEACDLVVVLSHLGIEGDRELARAVPEIPLIVGGHSHTPLRGGLQVGNTWIVQAGEQGEYLGRAVLHVDRRTKEVAQADLSGELIQVTAAGTPNARVEAVVEKRAAEVLQIADGPVGEAAVPLTMSRGSEAILGNLITDAMRAADLGDGRAFDVALHNDGGIRADLDAGPITFAELYAVLPFDNNLVGLDLTGRQVRQMLEDSINDRGSEVQVSGLSFVYTTSKARGQHVIAVTVGQEPLDEGRTYRVVTIDYLYEHPQYESSLGQGRDPAYGPLCLDAVSAYIAAHSPVHPVIERRIRRQ